MKTISLMMKRQVGMKKTAVKVSRKELMIIMMRKMKDHHRKKVGADTSIKMTNLTFVKLKSKSKFLLPNKLHQNNYKLMRKDPKPFSLSKTKTITILIIHSVLLIQSIELW